MQTDRIQDNNSSAQGSNNLVDQFKQNQDNSITFRQNESEQPQNKKKLLIGALAAVVGIGIIVMLILILSGKSSGDNPTPPNPPNPDTDHTLSQFQIDNTSIDTSVYGEQSFLINFNRSLVDSQRDPVEQTEINDFIDQVKVTSQGLGYESNRLRLSDFKKQSSDKIEDDLFLTKRYGLHGSSLENVERFYAPEVLLARGFNEQFQQGINYDQTGMQLNLTHGALFAMGVYS